MSSAEVIQRAGPLAVPYTYTLGATEAMRVKAAFVRWDGTGASGDFLACLSFYAQNGARINRVFPLTPVTAGGVADVSYAPFPGGMTATAGGGVSQVESLDTSIVVTTVGTVVDLSIPSYEYRLSMTEGTQPVADSLLIVPIVNGAASGNTDEAIASQTITKYMPAGGTLRAIILHYNADRNYSVFKAIVQLIGSNSFDVITGNAVNVPLGVATQLTFNTALAGSAGLMGLGTPAAPTFVGTGVYAVTVCVKAD